MNRLRIFMPIAGMFAMIGCRSSTSNDLPRAEAVDLPIVTIRSVPQYSDGSITIMSFAGGTNRVDDNYPVKRLSFRNGKDQIQVTWGGSRMHPPIMLDSNQVYTFTFGGKEITSAVTDQTLFISLLLPTRNLSGADLNLDKPAR